MRFGTGFTRESKVDEALAHVLVGRAVRDRRDDMLLATKVGFADSGPGALRYERVVAACEASVRRLAVDHLAAADLVLDADELTQLGEATSTAPMHPAFVYRRSGDREPLR